MAVLRTNGASPNRMSFQDDCWVFSWLSLSSPLES